MVGFPTDTTIAAVRLVYAGVLERFPRLRIAIGYRVGREHFGAAIAIAESPERYLERFWLDSVSYYDPALAAGIACSASSTSSWAAMRRSRWAILRARSNRSAG